MGFLIDSTVLIDYERGIIDLGGRLARGDEEIFVSVVTASELLHGVHRAQDVGIRGRRSKFVEGILGSFPLLPVDLATARVHALLGSTLAAAGTLIGSHDLWLAATCLTHGLTMVTSNLREFKRVPKLRVETWGTSKS